MSFVSRLFSLFVVANIFSASINSGVVFANEGDTKITVGVSDGKKSDENDSKDNKSKSELKNAGFVSVHREDCAFSYELDKDGNVKNVKDLLEGDKSDDDTSKNADGVCVYSSYSRFEVLSGNGTVEMRESNQDQSLSAEDSGKIENEVKKEESENNSEFEDKNEVDKNSGFDEIQDSYGSNEVVEEYDNDNEVENEG